jgi:hypothetical protein
MAEMAAGLLMWLSTTTKNVRKVDLEGVMALLDVRVSRRQSQSPVCLPCVNTWKEVACAIS